MAARLRRRVETRPQTPCKHDHSLGAYMKMHLGLVGLPTSSFPSTSTMPQAHSGRSDEVQILMAHKALVMPAYLLKLSPTSRQVKVQQHQKLADSCIDGAQSSSPTSSRRYRRCLPSFVRPHLRRRHHRRWALGDLCRRPWLSIAQQWTPGLAYNCIM